MAPRKAILRLHKVRRGWRSIGFLLHKASATTPEYSFLATLQFAASSRGPRDFGQERIVLFPLSEQKIACSYFLHWQVLPFSIGQVPSLPGPLQPQSLQVLAAGRGCAGEAIIKGRAPKAPTIRIKAARYVFMITQDSLCGCRTAVVGQGGLESKRWRIPNRWQSSFGDLEVAAPRIKSRGGPAGRAFEPCAGRRSLRLCDRVFRG